VRAAGACPAPAAPKKMKECTGRSEAILNQNQILNNRFGLATNSLGAQISTAEMGFLFL
jgi:hypothetical protein